MPSLAELMKQKLKEEDLKKIQEEKIISSTTKEISLQDLKPPKISEPIKKPPSVVQEQDFFIDWNYLTNNSSFQRGITEWVKYNFEQYKDINPRASKEVMNRQLQEKNTEINEALTIYKKLDNEQVRELNSNPLFLKQKSKNNQ